MSLNHIDIIGRICRDVEIRTTQNGTTVARFPVAVDRDYQSGGGERQTDFIDVVAFKNTASFLERNFRKGQMIAVSGRLQSRKWEDRDGNKRVAWEVVADSVHFCGDKKQEGTNYGGVNVSPPTFEEMPDSEGGLPF